MVIIHTISMIIEPDKYEFIVLKTQVLYSFIGELE